MRSLLCAKITPAILTAALLASLSSRSLATNAEGIPQDRTTAGYLALQAMPPEERGDLLMVHRQYLEAIDAYRHAPRDSAVVWNKLGMAYHHVYAYDQAKMDYQQALLLKPNYPEAMNNLGAVFYAQHEYRQAEKFYRRALKLDPRSAAIYNNLGTAYFADGKLRQGILAYRAAFELDPQVFKGDPLESISEGAGTLDRARLDYCLAELYAQAGMAEQAIEYLRRAVNEGFTDSKRLKQDPVFDKIRRTAEFAQVVALTKQP